VEQKVLIWAPNDKKFGEKESIKGNQRWDEKK
jgi:hypothetical protein